MFRLRLVAAVLLLLGAVLVALTPASDAGVGTPPRCRQTTTSVPRPKPCPGSSTSAPVTSSTSSSTSSSTTTPTSTTTSQPAPPPGAFPTEANTGTPPGWTPAQTLTGDLIVTTPGAVVQDVAMMGGNIWVRANNVTVRRVLMAGGRINNSCCINQPPGPYGVSFPGLLVEDTTFTNPMGVAHTTDVYYRLGDTGYTARRVEILDQLEGFRSGAGDLPGAGEVTVSDSYVRLDTTTVGNPGCGGHPDGVQGYVGHHSTITHNTIDLYSTGGSCENGAVFIADSSTGADVVHNLLLGGAYTLRANDGPFRLVDNVVADGTWQYGPLTCDGPGSVGFQVLEQHGNVVAAVNPSNYTVGAVVRSIAC